MSRHGSVGSWSCWPCCTCLCFPRPGPHNWTCAARSNDTLWWLYDTCIKFDDIRWYSYIFAFLQLEVKQHPQKLPFKFSLFMLQSPVKTVWRCSASPFSVPLPNWMLLIRDTNFRSKWWCKRRLIRLVSTFTTLVSAVLHCPMFRLFKHKGFGATPQSRHIACTPPVWWYKYAVFANSHLFAHNIYAFKHHLFVYNVKPQKSLSKFTKEPKGRLVIDLVVFTPTPRHVGATS